MAENLRREMIGDPAHLAFEFRPRSPSDETRGLAWGDLTLWVGGRRHWCAPGDAPVRWTWIDLVEHLARAWQWLLFEDVAPFGLTFDEPERLRKHRVKLAGADDVTPLQAEAQIFAYLHRHDLAAGLKGIFLPSLWMFREGNTMKIRADGQELWRPVQTVIGLLETLVESILRSAAPPDATEVAPRTATARALWAQRRPSQSRILQLRTALTESEVRALKPLAFDWNDVGDYEDHPLMAAARLSRPLQPDTRRHLLEILSHTPSSPTPELDALTEEAGPVLVSHEKEKPYDQGYKMASWLRAVLRNEDGPIDPEALLQDWGVSVEELPPLEPGLDAMACWGKKCGPAVFINPAGKHASSRHGRRATLSHEIAHLLMDRGRQLPAAEVMGGSAPYHLEQRARAFAAELLLPQAAVASAIAKSASFESAANELRTRFEVSNEVLGWQIRNGNGWDILAASDRRLVGKWCRQWKAERPLAPSKPKRTAARTPR